VQHKSKSFIVIKKIVIYRNDLEQTPLNLMSITCYPAISRNLEAEQQETFMYQDMTTNV
jgi:hypothetical protein